MDHIRPYDEERSKAEQIEAMFDNIAPGYDFMNGAMTFGLHQRWISKALSSLPASLSTAPQLSIIDLAAGTGDVTFRLANRYPEAEILGVDLSEGMLEVARKKATGSPVKCERKVIFEQGDCLDLKYPDDSFDLLTIAYGVRNFSDLPKGIAEFYRILKPGGTCMILELSEPENILVKPLYNLYSGFIIPTVAKRLTKDKKAYSYLPRSIKAMPPRKEIAQMLRQAGFKDVKYKSLTFGVVTYYIATK